MRKRLAIAAVIVSMAVPAGAGDRPAPATEQEKVSYAIGAEMARSVLQQGVEVDAEALIGGLRDGLSGGTFRMSDDALRKGIATYRSAVKARQQQSRQKMASVAKTRPEDNRKAGEAFLAANKVKDGVVTRPSGLQYRIVKAGDGRKPTLADTVECRYRGTFVDGSEFDSSERKGKKTAVFALARVIPGWQEAFPLMPAGSTWQLFVPPQLAYGAKGAPPMIGPNATLIFEVELISVK